MDLRDLVADYGDPAAEAAACRRDCALFDFSFMSRARVSGADARAALSRFCRRDLSRLAPGRIAYALRGDDDHVVHADLTVWCTGDERFELISGRRRDIEDFRAACPRGVAAEDLAGAASIFALQGPRSLAVLAALTDAAALAALGYFAHDCFDIAGAACRVGRLGYTGERGFEIVVPHADAAPLWRQLAAGARLAGFAAADRLRIEAGFMLFANECRVEPRADELGLARFYAPPLPAPRMRLVGFRAAVPAPPLWQPAAPRLTAPGGGDIVVTSACPADRGSVGLGFVAAGHSAPRAVDAGGEFGEVRLCALPMYDPDKQVPRGRWGAVGGR